MCFASGNKAAEAEQAHTNQQEKARTRGIGQVNELFGVPDAPGGTLSRRATSNASARKALLDKLFNDTNTFYRNDINRQSEIAQRNLRFNLARTGNLGGSVDIDKGALLTDTRNRALLDAGSKADQARSTARGADEQSRLDLIRQINAGLDTNVALGGANTALKQNVEDAGYNARNGTLGDAFSSLADVLPYSSLSAGDPAVVSPYRRRKSIYAAPDSGVSLRG